MSVASKEDLQLIANVGTRVGRPEWPWAPNMINVREESLLNYLQERENRPVSVAVQSYAKQQFSPEPCRKHRNQ